MKSNTFKKIFVAAIIFSVICTLAFLVAPPKTPDSDIGMWYSIIPPVLAIILAFITRHVLFSLGTAIVIGGILTQINNFAIDAFAILIGLKNAAFFVINTLINIENLKILFSEQDVKPPLHSVLNTEHLWILSFVILIFIMLKILIASGGFNGMIRLTIKIVKGKKSAQLVTAILGVFFFIDDYTNAIIVGSAMRPLTDRFRISREKLAFLVDATSAPVTGLAVISTWIATEISFFESVSNDLGMNKTGYSMFFDAIQFRFYCVLMLIFMFLHILMNIDFGPMKSAEKNANETGTSKNKFNSALSKQEQRMGNPASAIVPIIGLLIFHLTALWIAGGGVEKISNGLSPLSLSYWRQTISSVESSSKILIFSSTFGIFLAATLALSIEKLKITAILKAAISSLKGSYLPILILILAWSLKNCCDSLHTGEFLTSIVADNIPPLLFPALVFIVASITSFATGTSWGTMAILIPTAVPVAFALDGNTYGITTIISLGAVLDGAIFGDHCSPISDTTILSSIASQCDLIQHVRTQLPYSLFVAGLALVCGYLLAAMGFQQTISISIAFAVMIALFVFLKYKNKKSPAGIE